jgi:hypothetical protein
MSGALLIAVVTDDARLPFHHTHTAPFGRYRPSGTQGWNLMPCFLGKLFCAGHWASRNASAIRNVPRIPPRNIADGRAGRVSLN